MASRSKHGTRQELMTALNLVLRDVSGQGVLYSQEVAGRVGLNPTDLECLDFIQRGPLTAGALAEATGLTTGAITGVIDRLERAGFARRESDPADRRKVMVRTTSAIEKKLMPLYEPMQRHAMGALDEFGDKDLALLLDFLTRARDAARDAMLELKAGAGAKASSTKSKKTAAKS